MTGNSKNNSSLTRGKLQSFSIGISKKSAFQKQKEAEEARRKREEEEAALVYSEFAASFGEPDDVQKQETINRPSHGESSYGLCGSGPKGNQKASASAMHSPSQASGRNKRNLDLFLEELKSSNGSDSVRKHQRPNENNANSNANSNASTNIFVGNLNKAVTEMMLCEEFGVYGPIASVKIMKPYTAEEMRRSFTWGFVCFMNSTDAEEALAALNRTVLMGNTMNLEWGKTLPIPDRPFYVMPDYERKKRGCKQKQTQSKSRIAVITKPDCEVKIVIPTDYRQKLVVHRTIERVLMYGPTFETMLKSREVNNPEFKFLFDQNSPIARYYRWRMFSLNEGDSLSVWKTTPVQVDNEGVYWLPPNIEFKDEVASDSDAASLSDDSDSDSEEDDDDDERALPLTEKDVLFFEKKLRQISTDRDQIAELMVFCIRHSESADDIASILVQSLLLPSTPLFPTKLGRIYLLNDLLHNSGTKTHNAWRFRASFEKRLPEIMSHFGSVWKSMESRLKAEQMRKITMNLLAIWEGWMVFTPHYVQSLRNCFLEAVATEVLDSGSLKQETHKS